MKRGALVLIAGLSLGGCAGIGGGGDARAALDESLAGLQAGNYTFTRSNGSTVRGFVAMPGSSLEAAASAPPDAFPSDAPTEPAGPPLVVTISEYGSTPVAAVPSDATDLDPAAYAMLTNDVD